MVRRRRYINWLISASGRFFVSYANKLKRGPDTAAGLFIIAFETPRCYGHGGKRPPVYLRSNTSIDLHYAIPAVNRRARTDIQSLNPY